MPYQLKLDTKLNLEAEKNKIIEEIYLTGRLNKMYMGVHSNSKQNPIKSYIKQWLVEKGVRENLDEVIEDMYQELFIHIGKMDAKDLIELSKNNKKLFATICVIIQRHLMKIDVNPIINYIKKLLFENYNLSYEQQEKTMYWIEIGTAELKELKKVNKKKLKNEILNALLPDAVESYLLKLLKAHIQIQETKVKSTKVSYFEKIKHNSSQLNIDSYELDIARDKIEDSESNFKNEYGIGINDIMDSMTSKELKRFKTLANRKLSRAGKIQSKEQKEREKRYWDMLETNVFETINRIKFNR